MDYKRLMLNRLLDKYEKSKKYVEEGIKNRRIFLRMNQNEFPEYDIEQVAIKEVVNSVVQELSEKHIIDFEWLKYEKNNIIERIWLKLENIQEAYHEAGRQVKSVRTGAVLDIVQNLKVSITEEWIRNFLNDVEFCILSRKSLSPVLPDDKEIAAAILTALSVINDKGEEECLERVFSIKCYGDSKFFARRVRRRLAAIAYKYISLDHMNDEERFEDEILARLGIVKTTEQFEFCGEVQGKLYGQLINFSAFLYGSCINSIAARDIEIEDLGSVNKVLFIENKANYDDYIMKRKTKNELVIYHGGFYSPVKGLLFRKIYQISKQSAMDFYHWSDIDVGGFRIFNRLRTEIIPTLKPYLMDKEAFLSRESCWMKFDDQYATTLKEILSNQDFVEFHDVIKLMLEVGCKLEQEAFL